ncbi:MAG: B12-binding domain-containing radical SAM protein [Planctomycetota bacterium]
MKIILIYLPHPYLKQPDAQAPLGLMYLASVLQDVAGLEVDIKNYSSYHDEEAIADLPQADMYGITVTSLELLQANRFGAMIKAKYPYAKVGIGGPGAYTDEFVDYDVIDFACKGEGEQEIFNIIEDYRNDSLKNVYVATPMKDLDAVPFPSRHLLNGKQGGNIFAYDKNYMNGGSTIVSTSRGCPYQCSFCSSPFFTGLNKGVRYRSAKSVYDEIKHVIDAYGIRQFRFSDDMFSSRPKRVYEICELLGQLDIVWRVSTRVNPFDKDMVQTMFDAGCKEVSLGIESFDDDVLKTLNKRSTAEDNARALEIAKEVGMTSRVLFMIRTPGQTKHTVEKNITWLSRVPYDIIACTSFVPLPGSDIWINPDKYDIEILNRNLDDYNFYFFGKDGENELKDIIRIKSRDLNEFNAESEEFRDYLKETGKLNQG